MFTGAMGKSRIWKKSRVVLTANMSKFIRGWFVVLPCTKPRPLLHFIYIPIQGDECSTYYPLLQKARSEDTMERTCDEQATCLPQTAAELLDRTVCLRLGGCKQPGHCSGYSTALSTYALVSDERNARVNYCSVSGRTAITHTCSGLLGMIKPRPVGSCKRHARSRWQKHTQQRNVPMRPPVSTAASHKTLLTRALRQHGFSQRRVVLSHTNRPCALDKS